MKTIRPNIGWLLWAFTLIPFTFVLVLQLRNGEEQRKQMAQAFAASYLRIDHKFDLLISRHDSLRDLFQTNRAGTKAPLTSLADSDQSGAQAIQDDGARRSRATEAKKSDETVVDGLPPLPQGVGTESVIGSDLKNILSDERINPGKNKLSRINGAEATLELHRAQGLLKTLESEILLDVARAVESLREKGGYIDYAPGERYETVYGAMTVAEPIGDRTRMFYLFPEEFPEIYEKKQRKVEAAETAVRRLISIIDR